MLDFTMLSLNDIPDISNEFSIFVENTGYNSIMDCETIDELLINLYSYENPNITFEELQQKMIDYYYQEASGECVSNHLGGIHDYFHPSIMANLYERVMNMEYNDSSDQFNLNMIVEFITTPYGEEYLKNILEMIM